MVGPHEIGGLTINFEHNQKFLAGQHFILWQNLKVMEQIKYKSKRPHILSIQPKLDSMKHNMPISQHHLCTTISHWLIYIYMFSIITNDRNEKSNQEEIRINL